MRITALLGLIGATAACGGGGSDADAISHPDSGFPATIECGDDLAPSGDVALAKNIIFMMGDGMGPAQVRAGQIEADRPMSFEALPGPYRFNTDSVTTDDSPDPTLAPTDSAAAATAIASGTRTDNGKVGLDPLLQPVESLAEMARAEGKAIGLTTTSFLYDASPMAFAVHVEDRDNHGLILTQLFSTALPEVVLGGGLELREDSGATYLDMATTAGYTVLRDKDELAAWDPSTDPMALGIFDSPESSVPSLYDWGTTPQIWRDGTETDPDLTQMALRALDRLSTDPEGFFLFVENEHIDTLGHISVVERELSPIAMPLEVVAFDEAVAAVVAWVEANSSWDETLLVVAADHETGSYQLYGPDLSEALFWSPEHSRTPPGMWTRGPGSENAAAICRISDVHLLLTGQLPAP